MSQYFLQPPPAPHHHHHGFIRLISSPNNIRFPKSLSNPSPQQRYPGWEAGLAPLSNSHADKGEKSFFAETLAINVAMSISIPLYDLPVICEPK